MIGSISALLAVLAAAFVVVSLLARVESHAIRRWIVLVLWSAAIAGFLFIDVNIPLSASHLYPDSTPAPLWLALLAAFARFAAFASLVLMRNVTQHPAVQPRPEVTKADT